MERSTCMLIAIAALVPVHGVCAADNPQRSDQVPPNVWLRTFSPPSKLKVIVHQTGNTFTVTSPQLGLLHVGASPQLYEPGTGCEVKTELRAAERGFDITYDVSNPTSAALDLPDLVLPGFPLTVPVEYLNHAFGLEWVEAHPSSGALITPNLSYPAGLYSPVMVLRDGNMSIGLSLQYPVLEYCHAIQLFAARWPTDPNWTAYFFLQDTIAPGEKRRYVVAVRYAGPGEWIHTLQAYREYFWSLYGHRPSYVQDLRPVYGFQMAQFPWMNPGNPRGFDPAFRPDLNGWKPAVDMWMSAAVGEKYKRFMLWAPSGLYEVNNVNNYPCQFMTEWPTPMAQSTGELKRLQKAGMQVCFWWGHSAHLPDPHQWNPPALELFDPANPAKLQAMLAEWKLAVQRGADGAGLDAFEYLDLWLALPWLEKMRSIKPNAFFIAEAACADVMHLRVPFLLQNYELPTPHLLADYLVPGREIWVNVVGASSPLDRAKELISQGNTVVWIGPNIAATALEPSIKAALHESAVQAGPAAGRRGAKSKGATIFNRNKRR